jgi:hypothetical protein
LGNGTQLYYAHEHDECTTAQCPYYEEIWFSGNHLNVNEVCPSCHAGGTYAAEPDLGIDSIKAPGYDLYTDPDQLNIVQGSGISVTPGRTMQGIFRDPDTRQPRFAKVFTMTYHKTGFPDREFAIGVEITHLTQAPDFIKKSAHYRGKAHMYKIGIDPGQRECVILTP